MLDAGSRWGVRRRHCKAPQAPWQSSARRSDAGAGLDCFATLAMTRWGLEERALLAGGFPPGGSGGGGVDPRNLRPLVLEQLGEGDDLQAREGAAGFLLRPDADAGRVAFHRAGRRLGGQEHADGRTNGENGSNLLQAG